MILRMLRIMENMLPLKNDRVLARASSVPVSSALTSLDWRKNLTSFFQKALLLSMRRVNNER